MKYSIKDFFSKCDQIRSFLITFTEEILNGKFFVQCSSLGSFYQWALFFVKSLVFFAWSFNNKTFHISRCWCAGVINCSSHVQLLGRFTKTFPYNIRVKKISEKFPSKCLPFHGNSRNTRTRYQMYSNLRIKTSQRRYWRYWRRSGVFVVEFKHISHLFLVFFLLILNR